MTIDRIKVYDHKLYGEKVVQWTLDPATRPRTLAEFKEAVAGILELPDRITEDPQYIGWSLSNLIVRLPAPELVQESIDTLKNETGRYPAPLFYEDLVRDEPGISALDGLYSRIGDYTIAQCQ